jgi:hypothetical protein
MNGKQTVFLLFLLQTVSVFAAEYYVATSGNNTNPGTLSLPFETIQRAQEAAAPGDTVFLRGGLYQVKESHIARRVRNFSAYVFELNKSGTADAPIKYWAYPKETPVFDFSNIKPQGLRVIAFFVSGSWIHLKGFEVTGVQVTAKNHTQSECFENQGSHNIYETLSMHDGQAIGFYLTRGASNLVLNCDAFRNHDYISEDGKGGNTDGFGCHPARGGTGNVFRGCRAWFNSDDGYDCINSAEAVTFENCWALYSGFSSSFARLADGNGFKAGGYGSTPVAQLPKIIPRHVVKFCLAVGNKNSGFYANHHVGGGDWFNNTAYKNGNSYNMLCRQNDNVTDIPGGGHKMSNNLGYKGRKEVANLNMAHCELRNNYFQLNLKINDQDFISLDETQLTQPRQADGSLPKITLMHPAPGSQLQQQGADLGCSAHVAKTGF